MGFLALVHGQGSPEGSQILPSWISAAESPRSSCDLSAGAKVWAGGAVKYQRGTQSTELEGIRSVQGKCWSSCGHGALGERGRFHG